jgi:hypothetical protein
MSEASDFAALDMRVGMLTQLLMPRESGNIVAAAMKAGSIDAMPEPYRSWLSASVMTDIPDDVLLPAFRSGEME